MEPTAMDARRQSPASVAEPPDQELLAEYVRTRAPEAFGRIVARHGRMVLHTSHRLVGDWHDAEEVSQAVFLVLTKRAAAVNSTLAGWLYKVARDVSLQVLRARSRRVRREEQAVRNKPTPPNATEHELREELDLVLMQLPDRMREAVVLRYLEGRGQEESARLAGCDKGTLSRRCSEGLSRLGGLLSRRGVAVAPAVLTAFLASQAAASVPAASLAALQGVAATGAASAQAATLAQGAVNAMFWAKAKLCAAVVATATAVSAGAAVPLVLSSSPPPAVTQPAAETVLALDFEDGKLPAVCAVGKVVPTPDRAGNAFCLEGGPFGPADGKGKIYFQKDAGLFTFSDDLVLTFDVRVDGQANTVDFFFWNQTQKASQGADFIRVAQNQWTTGVTIRLADFRAAGTAPKSGDLIGTLSIQVGQPGGTLWLDNIELKRDPAASRK